MPCWTPMTRRPEAPVAVDDQGGRRREQRYTRHLLRDLGDGLAHRPLRADR
jgi:hypothetical protein